MAKKESTFIGMVLTLLIIAGIAGLALGYVNKITEEPRKQAQQNKIKSALNNVLPEFDDVNKFKVAVKGESKESVFYNSAGSDSLTFYEVSKGGEVVGTAIETFTDMGFSGRFTIMVGFLSNGDIYNTSVIQHMETPGLGDKMDAKLSDFPNQFEGKNPETSNVNVKQDGGEIDAITAATISSRAFCDAVNRAYDALKKQGGIK